MEAAGKSVNNFFKTLRFNPLESSGSDEHRTAFHTFCTNSGPMGWEGRLRLNRPLPGQKLITAVQNYGEPLESINGRTALPFSSREKRVDFGLAGFSESVQDYNLVQDWSDCKMITKGIEECEILMRREKISPNARNDLIESDSYKRLRENVADNLGDSASGINVAMNNFYGQYTPLSRLMSLDDSLWEAYRAIYRERNTGTMKGLYEYISPKTSTLQQTPVDNFLNTFDVAGAYVADDIRRSPRVVCETVSYVSRGSIYSAKQSHLLATSTKVSDGDLTVPSQCFIDLDLEESGASMGDSFFIYLCVYSEQNRLRFRVVKSKKYESFVCQRIKSMYCSSKSYLCALTRDSVKSLFKGEKYLVNVPVRIACKRIGLSTMGAINDENYTFWDDYVKIKRFYLDIGNSWYKL